MWHSSRTAIFNRKFWKWNLQTCLSIESENRTTKSVIGWERDNTVGTIKKNSSRVSRGQGLQLSHIGRTGTNKISVSLSFALITSHCYCFIWNDHDPKKVKIYFHFHLFFPPTAEFEGFPPKFTSTKFIFEAELVAK